MPKENSKKSSINDYLHVLLKRELNQLTDLETKVKKEVEDAIKYPTYKKYTPGTNIIPNTPNTTDWDWLAPSTTDWLNTMHNASSATTQTLTYTDTGTNYEEELFNDDELPISLEQQELPEPPTPTVTEEVRIEETNITKLKTLFNRINSIILFEPNVVFGGSVSLFLLGLLNRIPHDINLLSTDAEFKTLESIFDVGAMPTGIVPVKSLNLNINQFLDNYSSLYSSTNNRLYVYINNESEYRSQGYQGSVKMKGMLLAPDNTEIGTNGYCFKVEWSDGSDNSYRIEDLDFLIPPVNTIVHTLLNECSKIKGLNKKIKSTNGIEYEHYSDINDNIDIFNFKELPFTPISVNFHGVTIKLADPKWVIDAKIEYVNPSNTTKYGSYEEHVAKHVLDLNMIMQTLGYEEKIEWRGKNKECNKDVVQQPELPF